MDNTDLLTTAQLVATFTEKDVHNPMHIQLMMVSAQDLGIDFESFKGIVLIQAICQECDMCIHEPTFDYSTRTIYFYHKDNNPDKDWDEYTEKELKRHQLGEQYILTQMMKLGAC